MASGRARSGNATSPAFGEVLSGLKRRGCNLLVTGETSERVVARATRRLMGDPAEPRKRVLAFAGAADRHVDDCLPAGVDRDDPDVWVAEQRASTRSVPAATTGLAPPAAAGPDGDLGRLHRELVRAVDFFDEGGDLAPAELRLGVDSLDVLVEAYDRLSVKGFVRSTTELARGVDGLAHYHLQLSDDAPLVEELDPLFDARIELRRLESSPAEHRWHVPEHGLTTPWLRL